MAESSHFMFDVPLDKHGAEGAVKTLYKYLTIRFYSDSNNEQND